MVFTFVPSFRHFSESLCPFKVTNQDLVFCCLNCQSMHARKQELQSADAD